MSIHKPPSNMVEFPTIVRVSPEEFAATWLQLQALPADRFRAAARRIEALSAGLGVASLGDNLSRHDRLDRAPGPVVRIRKSAGDIE